MEEPGAGGEREATTAGGIGADVRSLFELRRELLLDGRWSFAILGLVSVDRSRVRIGFGGLYKVA